MAFFYTFKFVYHFPFSLCSQICPALPVSTFINPVFPFSTFIFFSKIHFILKHHYLNGLFLVFLFLLIINVKQIKIEDCNQHMRKNIQCLLFCIYVTSLNIIVSTFTLYLHISSIPFTPSSLNTLVIISYSLTLILTIIYVQNTL